MPRQPSRRGRPVIVDDTPWEDFGVPIVGSVLRKDGRFRIGYRAAGSGADAATYCYAESRGGFRWVKPQLGLVELDGSRANNIHQSRGQGVGGKSVDQRRPRSWDNWAMAG